MNSLQISLDVPKELLFTLNQTEEEFTHQIRLSSAIQLFKKQKLTLMQAADFAQMDWYQFVAELDKNDIAVIDYPADELAREIESITR